MPKLKLKTSFNKCHGHKPVGIYLYFKTKDELYGTIMVEVYRHFIHLFSEAERTTGTTYDCLLALIRSFISYCRKDKASKLIEVKSAP